MAASTKCNFSVRDLAESQIPSAILTASILRRRRGSRDLRNVQIHTQDDSRLQPLGRTSMTSGLIRNQSVTSSIASTVASVENGGLASYTYDEGVSPTDNTPTSFFDFDSDSDIDSSMEEDDPCRSPHWSSDPEWPLKASSYQSAPNRHKDSAIAFEPIDFTSSGRNSRLGSSSVSVVSVEAPTAQEANATVTTHCEIDEQQRRGSVDHDGYCVCTICRQRRHRRRKLSLCLFEKLEHCRHIMMTIRDPEDLSNLDRGVAYGHWLKLARLYVKYETLLDTPVVDFEQDESLLLEYMKNFTRLVESVKAEARKWRQLFDGRVESAVTLTRLTGQVKTTQLTAKGETSVKTQHRRAMSWTLKMLGSQGPVGNCRLIGSNFF